MSIVYIKDEEMMRYKKQSPEVFCKNSVLKNFANFTGNTCIAVSF